MSRLINKNKKAFGLLESLVAIAIFGVTIVMALSLIVKSLKIIKDNQISDDAAAVMVSALEYTRAPSADNPNIGHYAMELDSNLQISNFIDVGFDPQLDENNCSRGSGNKYYVDFDGTGSGPLICAMVIVESVNPAQPVNSDYIIRSRVVYKISDGFIIREIQGFKKFII